MPAAPVPHPMSAIVEPKIGLTTLMKRSTFSSPGEWSLYSVTFFQMSSYFARSSSSKLDIVHGEADERERAHVPARLRTDREAIEVLIAGCDAGSHRGLQELGVIDGLVDEAVRVHRGRGRVIDDA